MTARHLLLTQPLSQRGIRILVAALALLFLTVVGMMAIALGEPSTAAVDKRRTLGASRSDGVPASARELKRAVNLKLGRLKTATEGATDPVLKRRLQRSLSEVNGRIARGDFKGANLELNEALREAKLGP